jgi:hypothetical protein
LFHCYRKVTGGDVWNSPKVNDLDAAGGKRRRTFKLISERPKSVQWADRRQHQAHELEAALGQAKADAASDAERPSRESYLPAVSCPCRDYATRWGAECQKVGAIPILQTPHQLDATFVQLPLLE